MGVARLFVGSESGMTTIVRGTTLLLLALALPVLVGCEPTEPSPEIACKTDGECPGGQVCKGEKCAPSGSGKADAKTSAEHPREASVDGSGDGGGSGDGRGEKPPRDSGVPQDDPVEESPDRRGGGTSFGSCRRRMLPGSTARWRSRRMSR